MPEVFVPVARWERWHTNFVTAHGDAVLSVQDGALRGAAPDGAWFEARLPFSASYAGDPTTEGLAAALVDSPNTPQRWGVLLVRKGGFALARVEAGVVVATKVGQRHVQGRTKAGGQSQQRFARRRANQARVAYEAAADHAATVLAGATMVVTGGDHSAVDEVLTDARLRALEVAGPWLAVPDPKRAVLDQAVLNAQALVVSVANAGGAGGP